MNDSNPRAVSGGNNPPPDPPDVDPLIEAAEKRIAEANRWLAERGDIDEWDRDVADKAQFFLTQVQATFKALDDRRLDEGRKFDEAQKTKYGTAGDPEKKKPGKGPLGLLKLAVHELTKLRRGWLLREDERLEQERIVRQQEAEAARQAVEEAERKAKESATPLQAQQIKDAALEKAQEAERIAEEVPLKAQIKGTYTTTAKGLTERWSAKIVNVSDAFKYYNTDPRYKQQLADEILGTLERFARADAQALKDKAKAPPGVEFLMEKR